MARSSPRSTATKSCCLMLRRSTSGAGCKVTPTQFGRSGSRTVARCSASGSADRTAIVWDVATRQPRAQLPGHAQSVQGVGFSPDDNTLYTAGSGRVRCSTWELLGDRRFIPRFSATLNRRHSPTAQLGVPQR